jgi:hypothetical protein
MNHNNDLPDSRHGVKCLRELVFVALDRIRKQSCLHAARLLNRQALPNLPFHQR